MLMSMTGYGEGSHQSDGLNLSLELRALNNRHLKVTVRAPEPFNLLEAEFEKVVRRSVRRGTIQIHLRAEHASSPQDFKINTVALTSYLDQLRPLAGKLGLRDDLSSLVGHALTLPGVVPENGSHGQSAHDEWPLVEKTLEQALDKLNAMRRDEGKAMAQELLSLRDQIRFRLENIKRRIPQVVGIFRDRLYERVKALLTELDVKIDRNDLIREVSIFVERSDIAEEVIRLATHLDHFEEVMKDKESPGRKLEFLAQEMGRETNTMGSKASDIEISREVVEIKATLEKIRELVLNVE